MTTVATGSKSATDIIREKMEAQKELLKSRTESTTTTTKKGSKKVNTRTKSRTTTKKAGTGIPANIQKLPTKAAKIRALWMTGRWTRLQIARRWTFRSSTCTIHPFDPRRTSTRRSSRVRRSKIGHPWDKDVPPTKEKVMNVNKNEVTYLGHSARSGKLIHAVVLMSDGLKMEFISHRIDEFEVVYDYEPYGWISRAELIQVMEGVYETSSEVFQLADGNTV